MVRAVLTGFLYAMAWHGVANCERKTGESVTAVEPTNGLRGAVSCYRLVASENI
jgi:hypothetical protein